MIIEKQLTPKSWCQLFLCSHRYSNLFRLFIRQRVRHDVVRADGFDTRLRDACLRLVEPDERNVADVFPCIVRDDLRSRLPFVVADGDEARARPHRRAVQVQLHELYRPSVRIPVQDVLCLHRTLQERQPFGEMEALDVFCRHRRRDFVIDDERLCLVIDERAAMGRTFADQLAFPDGDARRTCIFYRNDPALAAHRRAQVEVLAVPMHRIVGIDAEDALALGPVRVAVTPRLDDEVATETVQINRQVVGVLVRTRVIAGRHHDLCRLAESAWRRRPILTHKAVLRTDPLQDVRRLRPFRPTRERIGELRIVVRVWDDAFRPDGARRITEDRERAVRLQHIRQLFRHVFHVGHARREDEPVRIGPIEETGERMIHVRLIARRVLEVDGVW